MGKSSAEYYNLEKVAEVLSVPTAEVNRLREQNKLRGFRDGTTWKFLKEEVHSYLAASIKARNAGGEHKPGDSDFDILGSEGSPSSFDLLVENAAPLPDDDELVAVSPAPQTSPASDLDLAALDNDDELALAEETRVSSVSVPKKPPKPQPKNEIIEVDEESSASLSLAAGQEGSEAVILDDNESVLGSSGSSLQLGLAGDSGFDMLVAGEDSDVVVSEDSDLLQVDEEKTSMLLPAEDFALEPSARASDIDDSESSSQVIAIDAGFAGMGQSESQEADPFGQADFSDFGADGGFQAPAAPDDPFGPSASPFPSETLPVSAPVVSSKKTAAPEAEYSAGVLSLLVVALVFMAVPGVMLIDMMVRMWSWSDPFILNSFLMQTLVGLFGL